MKYLDEYRDAELARQLADESIYIPMLGQAESLNAGVAGAILMFEVVRQREGMEV